MRSKCATHMGGREAYTGFRIDYLGVLSANSVWRHGYRATGHRSGAEGNTPHTCTGEDNLAAW